MKLHCSYSIVYTAILFCSFDEATCFTTKKNVDRNIDTKYRHSHYISRLHLSSIDQARLNGLDGFYYPPLLEDDSEQSDTYNNDNMRSSIMSSLPSSQPQIPVHMRIAKVCVYLKSTLHISFQRLTISFIIFILLLFLV